MPIYKNWQDFDAMRGKRKNLVIYGAGDWGHRLLNIGNVVPDYFCDKNAKQIKSVDHTRGGSNSYKMFNFERTTKEKHGSFKKRNRFAIWQIHHIFHNL
jgi:hypothetical protein